MERIKAFKLFAFLRCTGTAVIIKFLIGDVHPDCHSDADVFSVHVWLLLRAAFALLFCLFFLLDDIQYIRIPIVIRPSVQVLEPVIIT